MSAQRSHRVMRAIKIGKRLQFNPLKPTSAVSSASTSSTTPARVFPGVLTKEDSEFIRECVISMPPGTIKGAGLFFEKVHLYEIKLSLEDNHTCAMTTTTPLLDIKITYTIDPLSALRLLAAERLGARTTDPNNGTLYFGMANSFAEARDVAAFIFASTDSILFNSVDPDRLRGHLCDEIHTPDPGFNYSRFYAHLAQVVTANNFIFLNAQFRGVYFAFRSFDDLPTIHHAVRTRSFGFFEAVIESLMPADQFIRNRPDLRYRHAPYTPEPLHPNAW